MSERGQDHYWSQAAAKYEREFVDPFLPGVRSPLKKTLATLARRGARVVGDLGCGLGPLLPFLADRFERVHAVDFAAGMLERARERCPGNSRVAFHQRDLRAFTLDEPLDVAVMVNSLVMPNVADQEKCLRSVRKALKPGGWLTGILPAIDGVHYLTMLLVDRALDRGQPLASAWKNAAANNDHDCYDFALGQFRFQGLDQHFWQPFEIPYRLARCGFRLKRRRKVHLSWEQFAGEKTLAKHPAPWDWFFLAQATDASP